MSEKSDVVYGTKWTSRKGNDILVNKYEISSFLKNPQQMKNDGHDQTYYWILPFNFHLLDTYNSDYVVNRIYN